MNIQLKQQFAG